MDLGARLQGRHVLITGASGGLGTHFAEVAARCGAAVTVAARRRDRLQALVDRLEQLGAVRAQAVDLDVADAASVESAFAALREHQVDVLVNNAGISSAGGALDLSPEEFDGVLGTNLRGVWLMATAAARRWREDRRGGVIVNIASILGFRVAGGVAPYTISKAGVVQMTRALALASPSGFVAFVRGFPAAGRNSVPALALMKGLLGGSPRGPGWRSGGGNATMGLGFFHLDGCCPDPLGVPRAGVLADARGPLR